MGHLALRSQHLQFTTHMHTLQVPIQLSRETDFPLCTEPGSVQKAMQLCKTAVRNKADNAL